MSRLKKFLQKAKPKETTSSGSMPAFKQGPVQFSPRKKDLKKYIIAAKAQLDME